MVTAFGGLNQIATGNDVPPVDTLTPAQQGSLRDAASADVTKMPVGQQHCLDRSKRSNDAHQRRKSAKPFLHPPRTHLTRHTTIDNSKSTA